MASPAKRRRAGPSASSKPNLKPNLATLPYHLLLSILQHASLEPTLHAWPNSAFLLSCATVCRAFHDPAIAALYESPPTLPPVRAHRLLDAITKTPRLGYLIKRAVFEIEPTLAKKTPGIGYFELGEFVRAAKGLKELRLVHEVDRPPYRERESVGAWEYPEDLWDALAGRKRKVPRAVEDLGGDKGDSGGDEQPDSADGDGQMQQQKDTVGTADLQPVRLKSFRWNGLFVSQPPEALRRIHSFSSFQTLEKLSLIYIDTSLNAAAPDEFEHELCTLLSMLPSLHSLELETSEIANPTFFSLLPALAPSLRLTELRLINCPNLTADVLETILRHPISCGLQHLAILHNRATSLAFLEALPALSNLTTFEFDGNYYSTLFSHNDAAPAYDSLLPASTLIEWPWPASLQSLRLRHLRKWSGDEAEAFLTSLWESRCRLLRLRRLELHLILDEMGWRERARMREEWIPKLRRAFERQSPPPAPPPPPATASVPAAAEDPVVSDLVPPSPKRRRIKRVTRSQSRSDENLAAAEERRKAKAKEKEEECGMVEPDRLEIKMDASRPVEQLYTEEDFMEPVNVWGRASGSAARRGRGRRGGRRARGAVRRKTVIVQAVDSGDEEYTED